MPSDFNSADARTVNVGSGGNAAGNTQSASTSGLQKGPATGDSAVRTDGATFGVNTAGLNVGRTAVEGLDGPPDDAVSQDKKGSKGTAGTTKADLGYPHQSDPSSGVDGPTRNQV